MRGRLISSFDKNYAIRKCFVWEFGGKRREKIWGGGGRKRGDEVFKNSPNLSPHFIKLSNKDKVSLKYFMLSRVL